MNIIFGLFLIAHGLVHGLYYLPKPPKDPSFPFLFTKSWFAKKVGKSSVAIGKIFAAIVIAIFVLSGLFLIGISSFNYLWLTFAMIAAVISEFLFLLFWHRWLIIGFTINLAIIIILLRII